MGNIIHQCLPGKNIRPEFRKVEPNHMVDVNIPIESKAHPNYQFSNNFIRTTKYTIITFLPKNLFEQFHRFANIYFIFIVALNWIPQVQAFAKEVAALPVVFVLLVTAGKDALEDIRRFRSDRSVNNNTCMVYSVSEKHYVKMEWAQIHPGDFVHISCNAVIPADILFVRSSDTEGICHVETSNIDGESNLKQREVVQLSPTELKNTDFTPLCFKYCVFVEQPNPEIYSFKGYIELGQEKLALHNSNLLLRGCIIRNTDFVEGIVVYAGSETKAMQNNKGPRHKISRLESKINRDVMWCVILLLFLCFFCAIGSGIWLADYNIDKSNLVPFVAFSDDEQYSPLYQGFLVFWTYIIIFQSVIPLPLYVSLELVKLGQVYFITQDTELYDPESDKPVECRALNITEDLGQIEYVFSDKTGTLTENKMEFKCCTIGGVNYPHVPVQDGADDSRSDYDSRHSFASLSRTSCVMENRNLEPALERELRVMSLLTIDSVQMTVPPHVRRVQEFFLLMAVCNTVVVSRHKHADVMDESGNIEDQNKPGPSGLSRASSKDPLTPPNRFLGSSRQSIATLDSETSCSDSSSPSVEMHYEAESPDELALVKAAYTYGCRLVHRIPGRVKIKLPEERDEVEFEILKILHFDATRKRMSVIVRHPISRKITIYVKGADSCIFTVLHPRYKEEKLCIEELKSTKCHLDSYAKCGLRTLCMAKKVLSENEYSEWIRRHKIAEISTENAEDLIMESANQIEQNLDLLGATGIEDRLQEGVPETISQLQKAGIKIWVLTGDKQETAIQIAYAAHLFPENDDEESVIKEEPIIINADSEEATKIELTEAMKKILGNVNLEAAEANIFDSQVSLIARPSSSQTQEPDHKRYALVIDGTTLTFAIGATLADMFLNICKHCHSVVCCRATPFQKATVVKLVGERLKKKTLAIGDGANDVGMIQTADIGVGISGQEGMQAVMASDFSIAKFRFLERLLLVHGHWNHDRLAKFAALMFYKSLLSVLVLFWFQIYSGFSGSLMIDSLYLTMQHVIFTAAPPLANGIFDKDLNAQTLLEYPALYKPGQKGEMYTQWTFLVVTLDVIYQSLIIYFLPHLAYSNHSVGLWEFGTTIDVCMILSILLQFCIETRTWVWIQFAAIVLSFTLFWSFLLISNAIFFTFDHPSNPYWVMENTIASSTHSAIVIITCFVALLPRLVLRILQITVFPNEICEARRVEKFQELTAFLPENEVGNDEAVDTLNSGLVRTPSHPKPNGEIYFRDGYGEMIWSESVFHGNQAAPSSSNLHYSGHQQENVEAWRRDGNADTTPSFRDVPRNEWEVRKRGRLSCDIEESLMT